MQKIFLLEMLSEALNWNVIFSWNVKFNKKLINEKGVGWGEIFISIDIEILFLSFNLQEGVAPPTKLLGEGGHPPP